MNEFMARALCFAVILFFLGLATDYMREARKPKLGPPFYEHVGCLRGGLWLTENGFFSFKDNAETNKFVQYCQSLEK